MSLLAAYLYLAGVVVKYQAHPAWKSALLWPVSVPGAYFLAFFRAVFEKIQSKVQAKI